MLASSTRPCPRRFHSSASKPGRQTESVAETKKLYGHACKQSRGPPSPKTASKAAMESQTRARPFDKIQQTEFRWSTVKKKRTRDIAGQSHATKFPGATADFPSSSQASARPPTADNCRQGSTR